MTLGCKDLGIRKSEFGAKTQLPFEKSYIFETLFVNKVFRLETLV